MILKVKHTSFRDKKGKLRWKSLVRCESEFHVGDRDRLISRVCVCNGMGLVNCDTCCKIIRNKSDKMRKISSECKMGDKNPNYGKPCPQYLKDIISACSKGKKLTPEHAEALRKSNIGRIQSEETREKISKSRTGRFMGEDSPRWRFDLTQEDRENNKNRHYDPRTIVWRVSVYERDNFTCQISGYKGSGKLNAHHIYNWADFKDKRFEMSNGITLMFDIHKIFHSIYGSRLNTLEQFEEFCEYMKGVING